MDYLGDIVGAIWIIYQLCSKRWFQWRYVNRLTLQFSRKAEIVPNGLLKMCPRLEPQQHFEAACPSDIANLAVARVSCMSVCKMRPRPKPQQILISVLGTRLELFQIQVFLVPGEAEPS